MTRGLMCPCCRLPVTRSGPGRPACCPRTGRPVPTTSPRGSVARALTLAAAGVGVVAFVAGFATQRLTRPAKTAVAAVETPAPPVPPVPPAAVVPPAPRPAPAVAVAPSPRPVVPREPAVVAVAPAPRPGRPTGRTALHTLPVRIDARRADEVEKDLLGVREVTLDAAGGPKLSGEVIAAARRKSTPLEPAVVLATRTHTDLAGLPFRIGADALLSRERAEAMNALSRQLRDTFPKTLMSADDHRPDADRLFTVLTTERRNGKAWASPDSVACISQMLQAEGQPVRRMSCELLRGLPTAAATETLVKWAVFDTDPDTRAAAVDALRDRDPKEVSRLLVGHVRYPWPRAVEHACEALIALGCAGAVPHLAAAYESPDPDAPFEAELPGHAGGVFRREVVRVNHLKNCVLCHAPSFAQTDLIRGTVPDVTQPLPPPTSPSYYTSGGTQITAEYTYLRQDFSVVQPVTSPGPWPVRQRFDYVVSVRRHVGLAVPFPPANSPYRRAIGVAIRELSGRDPDRDRDWVRWQRDLAGQPAHGSVGEAARVAVLETKPAALLAVKRQEFSLPPTRMAGHEVYELVENLRAAHGAAATRLALTAYLDPLTRDPDPAEAARAGRLLNAVRFAGPNDDALAPALRTAARATD